MSTSCRFRPGTAGASVLALLLVAAIAGVAQEKKLVLQAVAYGTSTQLGHTFTVNITIESFSTPEEQQVLREAFSKGGNRALHDALDKMPARGRIAVPGTLGYEIKYARVWTTPTGRRIRAVTNRNMAIAEFRRDWRTTEYALSAVEIELSNDKGKSTGTMLPACQLKLNKQNELEIEAYQNPWRLDNFIDWSK